uniref:NADH dehydrogenase subunit 6 n=1 Tax=Campodea lubbockii TaxID=383858 RepID=Q0ZCZ5_9HEXA|nr:NADH dehydrogenase subunit 6 [Campodea lubbockii]ABF49585.1 NADH dehydrogenase subunit 6 [Campodea lubbockii]
MVSLYVILTLMIMNMSIMLKLTKPLSIIILIIIQTTTYCLSMSLQLMSSWLPLILLIILIGGMSILFLYMTSVSPNFQISTHFNMKTTLMFIMMLSLCYIIIMYLIPTMSHKMETLPLMSNLFSTNMHLSIYNLFSQLNINIMIFMVMMSYMIKYYYMLIKNSMSHESGLFNKN